MDGVRSFHMQFCTTTTFSFRVLGHVQQKIELTFYFWTHVAKVKEVDPSPLPIWNAARNLVKTGTHTYPKIQVGKKFKITVKLLFHAMRARAAVAQNENYFCTILNEMTTYFKILQ
jgi:hypothetical protein